IELVEMLALRRRLLESSGDEKNDSQRGPQGIRLQQPNRTANARVHDWLQDEAAADLQLLDRVPLRFQERQQSVGTDEVRRADDDEGPPAAREERLELGQPV